VESRRTRNGAVVTATVGQHHLVPGTAQGIEAGETRLHQRSLVERWNDHRDAWIVTPRITTLTLHAELARAIAISSPISAKTKEALAKLQEPSGSGMNRHFRRLESVENKETGKSHFPVSSCKTAMECSFASTSKKNNCRSG